ncbi:hydantoinase/oxoprolinase family protein [Paracoccus sp. IB05]|uniref:hydantoinase/oxoprolinase family protein n=1 Tax=Paracoccus sp. IB05 TaxID=2779367 RepID=UPI0018E871C0|nr:hydantoinase/oxoprolinase family protein [Paracoccus sp. IB05]MBJ2150250.1 hydantoinase/oxoprolinase family protein [Paracoccus sp. IB05]
MSKASSRYRLGVDIGGTFTDMLMMDEESGQMITLKVPSNRQNPEDSIILGLSQLAERFGIGAKDIVYFSHGTTLGVNTLLERDGADVGLITTRGFRDILEMRRLRLSKANDLFVPRPRALVPRRRVVEVEERLAHDGEVLIALQRDEVIAAARQLLDEGVKSIAVCFLHSYRHDAHEAQAKAWIHEAFPELYVITSSELWPQQREYERCLVSVINGYIGERMRNYFDTLQVKAAAAGMTTRVFSTKSNGGVMGLEAAGERPVETLLSGPASGVIGAGFIGQVIGDDKLITLDMGGTSVDMAVIDGEVPYSNENTVGDFPVLLPAVDVSAIGAGGGSVAWLDAEGVLKVGPRSAGARPGPACYSRGGTEPTVTDAYAALGIMSPDGILGGEMKLDIDKARTALATLGDRLGLTPEQTADAILQVATANIYAELVPQLARRGIDAADFSLLAYGAAGPTHVFMLARELNMRRTIVPPTPGTLCALGCLVADLRADFVRSLWLESSELTDELLTRTYEGLRREAEGWLSAQGVEVTRTYLIQSADICYNGQSFELNVVFPDEPLSVAGLERWFHDRYEQLYGFADRANPIRVLEARVQIVGVTGKPDFTNFRPFATISDKPVSERRVYEHGKEVTAKICQRSTLTPGTEFFGPAVIEQYDTTVYIPEGFRVTVDAWHNLIGELLK